MHCQTSKLEQAKLQPWKEDPFSTLIFSSKFEGLTVWRHLTLRLWNQAIKIQLWSFMASVLNTYFFLYHTFSLLHSCMRCTSLSLLQLPGYHVRVSNSLHGFLFLACPERQPQTSKLTLCQRVPNFMHACLWKCNFDKLQSAKLSNFPIVYISNSAFQPFKLCKLEGHNPYRQTKR